MTDAQAFEEILGSFPQKGGVIRVHRDQLDSLQEGLSLTEQLDSGSVIRQIGLRDEVSPASPLVGNDLFRGPGNHLPSGAPEIVVNPAQDRVNNSNIINQWVIEVIEE